MHVCITSGQRYFDFSDQVCAVYNIVYQVRLEKYIVHSLCILCSLFSVLCAQCTTVHAPVHILYSVLYLLNKYHAAKINCLYCAEQQSYFHLEKGSAWIKTSGQSDRLVNL